MSVQTSSAVRLGGFLLDRSAGGLFKLYGNGSPVLLPIGSRAVDVLGILVERRGHLVSKQAIMDAVWPGTAVEENNLTVQISTLRRVLDAERTGGSCIQTVPGRGYRLVVPLSQDEVSGALPVDGDSNDDLPPDEAGSDVAVVARYTATPTRPTRRHRRVLAAVLLVGFGVAIAALLLFGLGHGSWFTGRPVPPRLSLVVLPFENLSGEQKDDYLADGITDDLTSDLANLYDAFVIARETAYTYKAKPVDVRKIGEELGVRYVLEGSVRRIGTTLRVNVQLTSTETGAQLWSDRFDESISELTTGQEAIVTRMRSELRISLVEVEKSRSLRERPTNPDAFDLILQARSLSYRPPSLQRNAEIQALYERALELDPSSVSAMAGIAFLLVDRRATTASWGKLENKQRAESLLAQARALAPNASELLQVTAYWLQVLHRCGEAMVAAEEAIRRFPNSAGGYAQLGQCKIITGHAEEAIPLMRKVIRINPRSPYLFNFYRIMGEASVLLERDEDAITFLEHSLAISPENDGTRQVTFKELAAAYARSGQTPQAKVALAEWHRLFPYYHSARGDVPDRSVPVYAAQVRRLQEGLRLAGERDHADEDADFGLPADNVLHSRIPDATPTSAPGATTIRTGELAQFLSKARPLVIEDSIAMYGQSVPGAIGLDSAGLGGDFTDTAQDHLRTKMRQLTDNDLNRPIVALGWNSESFRGRNIALRLVALGYKQVNWYRGGREAWEVAGLPETDLDVQEW
jgi:TolB-like protein/DNA-binding winged helix-turn-helix (wHTH) protein